LLIAEDVCLLSYRLSDMQGKIKDVEKTGKKVGLRINEIKTTVMRMNSSQTRR
jgi:hypothetical protein